MNQFTSKFGPSIVSVLSGFDRIVFQGTMRYLCCREGMERYLSRNGILLKEFGDHALDLSKRIKEASIAAAVSQGAVHRYLPAASVSKEELARRIAGERNIRDGDVCAFTCVEPCKSFEVYRNRETKHLELQNRNRKCLHVYHYWYHSLLGWMNARLQTWFPFRIQICMNGRERLARQLDAAGIGYQRADNCFTWVEDFGKAQQLMDEQLTTDWSELFDAVARRLNPLHEQLCPQLGSDYYWTCHQSEWATDVVFSDPDVLKRVYPHLVRHGITTFASPDILRYMGHSLPLTAKVPGRFTEEISANLKTRHEGVRIKHRHGANSIKMYDKAVTSRFAVLRFEMTMNNELAFKVERSKEGGDPQDLALRPLRGGVVDIPLRAQVSDKILERYMTAQASTDTSERLEELLCKITKRTQYRNKPVRALRPFDPEDSQLLEAISHAEFAISGIRNRDLQAIYFANPAATPEEKRRRSGQCTRKLGLLRAHGIIDKVIGTHQYQVTIEGRKILTALMAARNTPVNQLLKAA
jgi:hypothetical protein